ncbi:N-acetyltransferase [Shouchella shacheensis]|uniref:N-acetyltransferase n=1 Tax=Shouchella shacheensis TaxID=1649580 RepID=UPI000A4F0009|nr:N-acetyltransferase [Shouchella shacheensis]
MYSLLNRLNHYGIHSIKNDTTIMLEVFQQDVRNSDSVDLLIEELLVVAPTYGYKRVTFECPAHVLEKLHRTRELMNTVGERVLYTKAFSKEIEKVNFDYVVWSPTDHKSIHLLAEVMNVDKSRAKKYLNSMEIELPTQYSEMFTAYLVNGEPGGIVFPHIEPDTDQEGRLFWLGMHPKYKGVGHGATLHKLGLYRLQKDCKAKTYMGATNKENGPMRKIMLSNGCKRLKNNVISLAYIAT